VIRTAPSAINSYSLNCGPGIINMVLKPTYGTVVVLTTNC